ncbi:MAG: hypothetical protein CMC96_14545 [Flavobacteriales bacterium]|nr:hypothetical protein [Flavobacteriales bacterium]
MLKALRNFSIYSSISVITGSISFLLLPILTSYLSTEDYGLLSIFNASVRFFSVCIGLGMGHLMLVDLIRDKDCFSSKLKSFFALTLTLTTLLAIGVIIVLSFSGSFFGLPVLLTITLPVIALLVVYFEFFTSVMVYLNQAAKFAVYSLGKFGVETLLTIVLVVGLGMNWTGRVLSLSLALIIIALFLVKYVFKNFSLKSKILEPFKQIKELARGGGALAFMSMSFMVINLSDRFLIEKMIGIEATGIYGVAATVAGVMFMFIGALMKVIRPKLYEVFRLEGNSKGRVRIAIGYHTFLALFGIGLFIVLPYIFEYFIDSKFNSSLTLSRILIVGLFFWGSYSFFISKLLYYKKNQHNAIIAVISMVINLVLNYFMIKEYGIQGAAFATVITYVCMFVSSIIYSISKR